MTREVLLEFQDLHLSFGQRNLARSLSLSVREGERIGLFGANGVGKTTLSRAILGLHPVQGGSIHISGTRISNLSGHERSRLFGYVPQITGPIPCLNIEDFYHAILSIRGRLVFPDLKVRCVQVGKVLGQIGLAGREQSLLPHLSGGELKRVFVGAALLLPSKLFILDEPTASLDPEAEEGVFQFLEKTLNENPKAAALIISHDERRLFEVCDRVFQLRDGELFPSRAAYGVELREQA